jgi:hypothetical protein
MKCDGCGCKFSPREAEIATHNEAVRSPGRMPYTEIRSLTLCPRCAGGRKGLLGFYAVVAVLFLGGLLVMGCLMSFVR